MTFAEKWGPHSIEGQIDRALCLGMEGSIDQRGAQKFLEYSREACWGRWNLGEQGEAERTSALTPKDGGGLGFLGVET